MAVLLIAEVAGGELNADATGKALTAAKSLGDVTVLCAALVVPVRLTPQPSSTVLSKVLCADDAAYGNDLAEPMADLIGLAGRRLRSHRSTFDRRIQKHPARVRQRCWTR